MFVKIKIWNVDKEETMGEDGTVIYKDLRQETLYDVMSVDSVPILPEEGKEIGKMLFTLKLSSGVEEVVYVPWEDNDEVVEIYCMNNRGKTIDKYVY